MKTLRICLLILLAALLPIRNVVASTMLCPPAGKGSQVASVGEHQVGEHPHAGHLDAGPSRGTAHHSDSSETCNLCCYFCAMTPLLSALPSLAGPLSLLSGSFPELAAPAPSFLSGGQERPPRST